MTKILKVIGIGKKTDKFIPKILWLLLKLEVIIKNI